VSYCRWSTDDFRCDLYCYQDVSGGWTTHVASSRYVGEGRPHEDWSLILKGEEDAAEFWRQHAALEAWLDKAKHESIGLPYDGATFHDYTLEGFLDLLITLKEAGYCFPDHVIDDVREEIREEGG
jgi:hypothetical protein